MTARTKVALSMLSLVPGGMGGTETYARALTRKLDPARIDARCFVPGGAAGFSEGVPETVVPEVTAGPSTRERLSVVGQSLVHRRAILRRMAAADVVHLPFTAEVPPLGRRIAKITTIHDVQHLDLPELFSAGERAYRRFSYERPARSADAVITISNFAQRSIVEHLGIAPEKVHVIPLGVDTAGFVPNLGERENFLLYPARPWAHKNHRRLIEAVEVLRREDPELRLVLTGGELEKLGELPDWVDARGLVPLEELRDLYRRARMLVFPSRYEGFGLPLLEAMASGCPVAASNAGSIPEVCGDAAVFFDPESVEGIVAAVRTASERTAWLQQAGLARVREFSWDTCVRGHEDVYTAVAEGRRR